MNDWIIIKGAKENNLKNITLSIPKNKLVVLTGLSGSGKSTLAFDTLQKECQRQYMESMGMVTDFLSKPKVDVIIGLSPSISVDQHLVNRNPRSTVGTVTEVFTYLRLLFAKLGERPCSKCGEIVKPSFELNDNGAIDLIDGDTGSLDVEINDKGSGKEERDPNSHSFFPCPHCGNLIFELSMAHFSFNKPEGACPTCTGLGVVSKPNIAALINEERNIFDGGVAIWEPSLAKFYEGALRAAGKYYGFEFNPELRFKEYSPEIKDLLLYGVQSPEFRRHFPEKEPPTNALNGRFEGIITGMMRKYADHSKDDSYREKIEKYLIQQTCPDCAGTRLREESRKVMVDGKNIIDLSLLSLLELEKWIEKLIYIVSPERQLIIKPIIDDLTERIKRLNDVGAFL